VDHLDLDRILEALAGGGETEKNHLAGCERCRAELERWRGRLEALRAADAEEVTPKEEHRLRVLFRQFGPSPQRTPLLARLVRTSAQPTPLAATRGRAAALSEFQAGAYSATVQVLPGKRAGRYEVHGSLLRDGGEAAAGSAALTGERPPYGDRHSLDEFGEFHFSGVPGGTYRVTWAVDGERIEVEELTIGDEGGRPES